MEGILAGIAFFAFMIGFCAIVVFIKEKPKTKDVWVLGGIGVLLCLPITYYFLPQNTSSGSHECTICGKREGLRQIAAITASGEEDPSWYCEEHYADAWQYYYGQ